MSTKKYSVKVTPDSKEEQFTESSCKCNECRLMHMAQLEWDTFIPQTNLQQEMKKVVSRIETRERDKAQ